MQQRALEVEQGVARLNTGAIAPEPTAGEVLVRPSLATIGSIEVAAATGLIDHAGTLGCEFVGNVEALGDDVQSTLLGQRVVASMVASCGACDLCRGGLGAHCRERTILGVHGRAGGLADAVIVPASSIAIVPERVDNDHAVFANTAAAALQTLRQLTIENKPYVTVLGDGPVGLIVAQIMSRQNASVRVIGRHPEKLGLCEKWGIRHRHVDDIGRRADQDIVVDCTGSAEGIAVAMRLVRPRGTILQKTLVGRESPVDLSPLVLGEMTMIGSFAGPVHDAMLAIARQEIDVISLISRRTTLAEGEQALRQAQQPEMLKILVDV